MLFVFDVQLDDMEQHGIESRQPRQEEKVLPEGPQVRPCFTIGRQVCQLTGKEFHRDDGCQCTGISLSAPSGHRQRLYCQPRGLRTGSICEESFSPCCSCPSRSRRSRGRRTSSCSSPTPAVSRRSPPPACTATVHHAGSTSSAWPTSDCRTRPRRRSSSPIRQRA